jgi:hypothetical protein
MSDVSNSDAPLRTTFKIKLNGKRYPGGRQNKEAMLRIRASPI